MLNVEVKPGSENAACEIIFSGFLDVSNSKAIKEKLDKSNISGSNVILRILEPDNIDVSFLQILYSFIGELKRKSKTVDIMWEMDDEFFRLIDLSGFVSEYEKIVNG